MNFSAIFIDIARRAIERLREAPQMSHDALYGAIVFSWLSVEALLNELAYLEITQFQTASKRVYQAVERGARGFERIQAILSYLYGRALIDGANPANDLKLLGHIRNGLVHYRFEDPPSKTLDDLSQRGLVQGLSVPWSQSPFAWPVNVLPSLAHWAHSVACATAHAIADLMPTDEPHAAEAALIRRNFDANVPPLA